MPPLPESSLAPTPPVFDPDPLPSLVGTARIEAATFALCNALAAHRPDPLVDMSPPHIAAAIGDSLLEHFSEERQTEDLVAGIERASGHLAFGLANFSHRALNRAYAVLDRTLAPSDGLEPGRLMSYGLDIGANVLRNLEGDSPLQYELRQLAASAFSDALHGTGPTIDADTLQRKALSGDERDQAHVAALQAFRPVFKRLEQAGLCPAPVFHTTRRRTLQQGWNPVEDSGKFETQSDIFDTLVRFRPDDVTPLPRLSALHPDVHQTLDREKGHLLVRFPASAKVDATVTTLKLPAIGDGKDPIQRSSQDDALDTLDRFCAASFDKAESLWSLRPPAITLDDPGRKIRVGELPVATLTKEAWSLDPDAASHVAEVLERPARRTERPVHDWAGPRVPLARTRCPPGHRNLRLVLQVEDDPIVRDNAASRQLAHPHETVWIQMDSKGRGRVLAGDSLLAGLPGDARIKVEVHGHGGRIGLTDQRSLAGRSAMDIGFLLGTTMDRCGLLQRIDAVDLASCSLATPVFPQCFAEEVLRTGHDLALFHSSTEVTAYTDALTFTLHDDSLEKFTHRRTLFAESSEGDIHAPGKSLAFSLERGTGKLIVRDKHPEVEPDRPTARPATRSPEAYPAEDATDLPTVSPWAVRGPGMAI